MFSEPEDLFRCKVGPAMWTRDSWPHFRLPQRVLYCNGHIMELRINRRAKIRPVALLNLKWFPSCSNLAGISGLAESLQEWLKSLRQATTGGILLMNSHNLPSF